MLKRENRLTKKYMFAYCYSHGNVVHGKTCILHFSSSKNKAVKLGIVTSKKVGGAVQRNRARRQIREAITPSLPLLNKDFNLVLVARENFLSFTFEEIKKDIEQMLKKAGLFEQSN